MVLTASTGRLWALPFTKAEQLAETKMSEVDKSVAPGWSCLC